MDKTEMITVEESYYSQKKRKEMLWKEKLQNHDCVEKNTLLDGEYDIFKKRAEPKKYFFGLFKIKVQDYICTIDRTFAAETENPVCKINLNQKQNLDFCKKLAEELVSVYGCKIEIITYFEL